MSNLAITCNVAADLAHPIGSVVPTPELCDALFKIATVPKVAIAEDCKLSLEENNVRSGLGRFRNMKTITQPTAPQLAAQNTLAPRITL